MHESWLMGFRNQLRTAGLHFRSRKCGGSRRQSLEVNDGRIHGRSSGLCKSGVNVPWGMDFSHHLRMSIVPYFSFLLSPSIGSMYGTYANIWGILMVNGKPYMAYIRIRHGLCRWCSTDLPTIETSGASSCCCGVHTSSSRWGSWGGCNDVPLIGFKTIARFRRQ